jgi:uncharacterized protein YkwD
MKKRPVLHQFASLCVVAGIFFSTAFLAHASTLTLPQQYNYPGLTFSDPLMYTQPLSVPEPTQALSFASQNALLITKDTKKKPLEELVISPTVAITNASIQNPTPTLYQPSTTITETLPSPTPQPTTTPTTPAQQTTVTTTQPNPGGLNADVLFSMVNSYRQSQGLPAFQQDAKTCSLAQQRAPQVDGEIAAGDMHAGLKALNLPYWNTENIISMNSEAAAFNWWLNDPIHHEAIVSNATYSCVACSGNACAEEFTSYVPK